MMCLFFTTLEIFFSMSCYIEVKEIELRVALDGTEGEKNLILWMPLTLHIYHMGEICKQIRKNTQSTKVRCTKRVAKVSGIRKEKGVG